MKATTQPPSAPAVACGNRSSPARQTVVVVGNGPVGFALVEKLVRRCVPEDFGLVVFGEEPRPAYDRVNLTSYLQERNSRRIEFAPREWYAARGIALHTADPVIAIDRPGQCVRSRSGIEVQYDTLVLATGSRPFVPNVEGRDLPGVFVYRTVDDLEAILEYSQRAKSAAVLGGGLLGLEAARALMDLGLTTHVVEMAPVLMPRQIDSVGGELLAAKVQSLGVQVHLLKRTQRIRAEGRRRLLEFDGEETLAVDLVVVATGIRPRDELAHGCGLEVGPKGGIVVDDRLQTSDPRIFAIGECALHRGTIYGLAAPGYQMADVLATNLSGGTAAFAGNDESTRLKLFGVDVFLCGEFLDVSGAKVLANRTNGTYRKLILRDRRLVGAVSVGEFPELLRIQEAISRRRRVSRWQRRRFHREGSLWSRPRDTDVNAWPADAIVCSCTGVSRGTLSTARAAGCDSAAALATATRASTVCGSCRSLVAAIACGAAALPAEVRGWRVLLGASICAALAVIAIVSIGPIEYADSVESLLHQIDFYWRDRFSKQVTGFSLLGLSAAALVLSLRKRWNWLRRGEFGLWRAAHGVIGLIMLLLAMVHTGLHLGSNLNLWLMITFLGINLMGAATGMLSSLESRASGAAAQWIRRWRPRMTLLHVLVFWPFPILLAFHVLAVYYF